MSDAKAINLRFPDPEQRAAIAAAAKAEGVSMQEYILGAAYARATALQDRFLDSFRASMARSGAAFADEPSDIDPTPQQRAAERDADQSTSRPGQGHAA